MKCVKQVFHYSNAFFKLRRASYEYKFYICSLLLFFMVGNVYLFALHSIKQKLEVDEQKIREEILKKIDAWNLNAEEYSMKQRIYKTTYLIK